MNFPLKEVVVFSFKTSNHDFDSDESVMEICTWINAIKEKQVLVQTISMLFHIGGSLNAVWCMHILFFSSEIRR